MKLFAMLAPLALAASMSAAAEQQDIEFSSGVKQVALLELYTSEGCSSCPPADRWLRALKKQHGLWENFVPIAFHVDYWDYIGWQDRFASAEFSNRQRRYADEGGARSVYTPGFFSSGSEWLGWRRDEQVQQTGHEVGNLSVRLDGSDVSIHFDPAAAASKTLVAHVALLGMDLETEVRAGENRGRKLLHDFVALGLSSTRLKKNASGHSAILQLPDASSIADNHAVVVWVSDGRRLTPIQATGGYLRR